MVSRISQTSKNGNAINERKDRTKELEKKTEKNFFEKQIIKNMGCSLLQWDENEKWKRDGLFQRLRITKHKHIIFIKYLVS